MFFFFQNWHVSTEHFNFSISILLTENIFVAKKIILSSFIQNIPRNSQRNAHLMEECSIWIACLAFFFFFQLIIWFHCKVVGIENYAICSPIVFLVREIPDTFLPGLIITSQTLVAGRLSLECLLIKPHTTMADRWLWGGCGNSAVYCQQPACFETLTFSLSPQRVVLLSLLSCFSLLTLQTQEEV